MSDLVNRLCGIANEERHNQHVNGISFVCDQAADRIAALEALNESYLRHMEAARKKVLKLKATIKAIRELPRYNRYQVMDDTADDNSSRWILADELEALLPEKDDGS